MFENAHGFIVCKGLAEPEGAETTALGNEMWMADRRLHKFINDEVLKIEKDNCFFWMDMFLTKVIYAGSRERKYGRMLLQL